MHQLHSKWKKPKPRVKRARSEANREKSRKRWAKANESTEAAPQPPTTADDARPSTSADQAPDYPRRSTSATKFRYFEPEPISESDSDADADLDESRQSVESDIADAGDFVLVHKSFWPSFVSRLLCPQCKCNRLKVMLQENHGFVKKIISKCMTCDEAIAEEYTSPRLQTESTSTSSRPAFLCNRKIVDSFLDMGTGHCGLERFCVTMEMEILTLKGYMKHLHSIIAENKKLREDILTRSRDAVRNKYIEASPTITPEEVIDIQVSFDGSWPKRGHTSLAGFTSVIETTTGLVVDFVILSKHCHVCAVRKIELCEGPEFDAWKTKHIESGECDINYEGSAGNMEVIGAEIMWNRSIEVNLMRYTTMLFDGDSKAIAHLNEIKPYGSDVEIKKEDCINHVGKRMGTSLRNLVQQEKVKGVTLGGKKAGALTDATIIKLQSYYQKSIKKCLPDIALTRKQIMATLEHTNSTDDEPKHALCPEGKNSWCFFNRAKAKKEKPRSHEMMSVKINNLVYEKVKPIFERLADETLLSRCVSLSTQNPNESLHSVIWNKCSKEIFMSKRRLEIGVTRGVGEFNMGLSRMTAFRRGGQGVSKLAKKVDARREYQSSRQSNRTMVRAQKKASKKKQGSKDKKKEGITYAPGAF